MGLFFAPTQDGFIRRANSPFPACRKASQFYYLSGGTVGLALLSADGQEQNKPRARAIYKSYARIRRDSRDSLHSGINRANMRNKNIKNKVFKND